MNTLSVVHQTQEQEILELLEIIHISGVRATRLLEGDNHEALMRAFDRVHARIARIIEKKKKVLPRGKSPLANHREGSASKSSINPDSGIEIERSEVLLSRVDSETSSQGGQISSEEKYLDIHRRLFARQKDARRFFVDLVALSKEDGTFPNTIDGWIVYLGLWEKTIALLSDLLKQKSHHSGDIGIIAKFFLAGIFGRLSSDSGYLSHTEPSISLGSERTLRFTSLYDIFYYLGEGGASQVIYPILHTIRLRGGPFSSSSEPLAKKRAPRKIGVLPHPRELPLQKESQRKPPESTYEREEKIILDSPPPSENLLRATSDIASRSALEFRPSDLIETAFGSILLSATVTDHTKIQVFTSLFPEGIYRHGREDIFVTN